MGRFRISLVSLAVLPFLGTRFLPDLREGSFIVHLTATPGTSLPEALRIGRLANLALLRIPGVLSVDQRAGRAERSTDTEGVNYSELDVRLGSLSASAQSHVLGEIRDTLAAFPGITTEVESPLSERIHETISGHTGAFVVNLYGNNLDTLDRLASLTAQKIKQVPGARDVRVVSPPGTPELGIRLRSAEVSRWGFDPVDILDEIQSAQAGVIATQTFQDNRVVDVRVLLETGSRGDLQEVGNLLLRNPDGMMVPLDDMADIAEATGRSIILHESGQRLQTVTANVSGQSLDRFARSATGQVSSIRFPKGYYAMFSGDSVAQSQAEQDLIVYTLMVLFGIVLILSIVLADRQSIFLLLGNIPFALMGVVVVVILSGGVLSLGSIVGFVTLFGISLRNSLMLITHYRRLVGVEGLPWNRETAILGALDRMTPILMTALVTSLALSPLALTSGAPGNEIEGPMALVIFGGLMSSSFLTLLIMPILSLRFGNFSSLKKQSILK